MGGEKEPFPMGRPRSLDFWLAFPLAHHEDAFRKRHFTSSKMDEVVFMIALVAGPTKVLSWRNQDWASTVVHHTWYLVTSCVLSAGCIFLLRRRPQVYRENRLRLITALRLAVVIGGGMTFFVHDPRELWLPTVLAARVFSQTPVTSLFSTSLLGLPFKRHFWVQLVGASLSCAWVTNLCAACEASAEVDWAVNQIGWITDGVVTRTAMLGFPVTRAELHQGQFSCWLVGLFYHFWLGFFLPCVGCYIMELLVRVAFLENSAGGGAAFKHFATLKVGRLLLVGLSFIVGTQALWIILKGFITQPLQCQK